MFNKSFIIFHSEMTTMFLKSFFVLITSFFQCPLLWSNRWEGSYFLWLKKLSGGGRIRNNKKERREKIRKILDKLDFIHWYFIYSIRIFHMLSFFFFVIMRKIFIDEETILFSGMNNSKKRYVILGNQVNGNLKDLDRRRYLQMYPNFFLNECIRYCKYDFCNNFFGRYFQEMISIAVWLGAVWIEDRF